MTIQVKRVYETPSHADGMRVLVDGLWPRGLAARSVQVSDWVKELAPSKTLRKWFDHNPGKWAMFKQRYFSELDGHPDKVNVLVEDASDCLTLVYSAKDEMYNNAVALKEYIEKAMQKSRS